MARQRMKGRARGRRAVDSTTAARRSMLTGTPRSAAERSAERRFALACAVAVGALALTLYSRTAPADIVLGDTPEFMIVAATQGVAHAPGYPLLTMLSALVAAIPWQTLPHRLDLFAAGCSAGTVVLVYLIALRLTAVPLASAAAALLLAANALFWRWANVLEAFPLNNLLAAALVLLVVLWHERPERSAYLVGAALIAGLGMTNHQTIGLLAPAVLHVLWRRRRSIDTRLFALCAGAFAVGLLPYAYVPIAAARHPAFNWQGVSSFGDLIALITRQSYGSTDLIPLAQYRGGSAVGRVAELLVSYGAAGVLVLVGAVSALRRARSYAVMTMLAFGLTGVFFAAYSNVNLALPFTLAILERFFLLPLVVTAPFAAFGVLELADRLRALVPAAAALARPAVSGGSVALALALAIAGYGEADRSDYRAARTFAEDILATLEPNTLLFAGGDEVVLPLSYLQLVERRRPDVRMLMLGMLNADWYLRQVRTRYPDLVVPFARYVGQKDAMLALAEANQARPIALVGIAPDASISDKYWWLARGLTLKLLPLSVDVTLDDLEADNQRLFAAYRPPDVARLRNGSLDRILPINYARAAFTVGLEHENVQQYAGARRWYERALALDPEYGLARERLRALPK